MSNVAICQTNIQHKTFEDSLFLDSTKSNYIKIKNVGMQNKYKVPLYILNTGKCDNKCVYSTQNIFLGFNGLISKFPQKYYTLIEKALDETLRNKKFKQKTSNSVVFQVCINKGDKTDTTFLYSSKFMSYFESSLKAQNILGFYWLIDNLEVLRKGD